MVTTTDIRTKKGDIWKVTAPDHVTVTPPPDPNNPDSPLRIGIDYHPSDVYSSVQSGRIDLKFEEPAGKEIDFGLRAPVEFYIKNSLGVQMEGFSLYLANENPNIPSTDIKNSHPSYYAHFHNVDPNAFPGATLNLTTQDFITPGAFGGVGMIPAPGVINVTGVIVNGATISNQAAPIVLHGSELPDHNDNFHLIFSPNLTPEEVSQARHPILYLAPPGPQPQSSDAPDSIPRAVDLAQPEGNSGTTLLTFTVTRLGDLGGACNVTYAVTGSGAHPAEAADFAGGTLPSGTVSFAAGEVTRSIVVSVAGDTTVEPNETFTLALLDATNGARIASDVRSATGTIRNDDATPTPHHPDYPDHDGQVNGPDDHVFHDFALA